MMHPETQLQIAVAEYLDLVCPHFWSAIEHGIKITPRQGKLLKKKGVKRGLMDILIWIPDGTISIELKAGKGAQSDDQWALGHWLDRQSGHSYHVCRSIDDVEAALLGRGVVLGARV